VEFRTVGGSLMYARASTPSGTIQDIRAIAIEEKVGQDATAEEIYDSSEIIAPQTDHEHIFVHKEAEKATGNERQRWFGIDIEFYNKLPTFPWYQIFNMTGAPLMEVKVTGAQAQKPATYEIDEKKKELGDDYGKFVSLLITKFDDLTLRKLEPVAKAVGISVSKMTDPAIVAKLDRYSKYS
jgi:hypothetical protein